MRSKKMKFNKYFTSTFQKKEKEAPLKRIEFAHMLIVIFMIQMYSRRL